MAGKEAKGRGKLLEIHDAVPILIGLAPEALQAVRGQVAAT